jgi:hypothetical protein
MKNIILFSKKETIEISYPDFLSPFMKIIGKYLRAKTIKRKNGATIKMIAIDEANNLKMNYKKVKEDL